MTSGERLAIAFRHGIPDRLPLMDAYWNETLERWRAEGLPKAIPPLEFCGLDKIHSIICDHSYRLPEGRLEEDDTFLVTWNSMGMVQRFFKDRAGAPAYLDHLIKSKADWERYQNRIHPATAEERIPEGALAQNQEQARAGAFCGAHFADPIWCFFHSCGFENALVIMVEDPIWAAEMVMAFTELQVAFCEALIRRGFTIQGIFVYGDIAFNNGPFFSLKSFDQISPLPIGCCLDLRATTAGSECFILMETCVCS